MKSSSPSEQQPKLLADVPLCFEPPYADGKGAGIHNAMAVAL